MLLFLLIATASVAFADEAQTNQEQETAESKHSYSYKDGLELIQDRNRQLDSERYRIFNDHENEDHGHSYNDYGGPIILRKPYYHDGHIDIEAQNRIIEDVYSPDFYQPTWVIDYRYMKSGGRDYVRGPGGQIIILPKGVRSKDHKKFPDYDTYLEHLRLSRLAEEEYIYQKEHHDDHHDYQGHGARGDHDYSNGHGQTIWRQY